MKASKLINIYDRKYLYGQYVLLKKKYKWLTFEIFLTQSFLKI
jgi:hypothetical protein